MNERAKREEYLLFIPYQVAGASVLYSHTTDLSEALKLTGSSPAVLYQDDVSDQVRH